MNDTYIYEVTTTIREGYYLLALAHHTAFDSATADKIVTNWHEAYSDRTFMARREYANTLYCVDGFVYTSMREMNNDAARRAR